MSVLLAGLVMAVVRLEENIPVFLELNNGENALQPEPEQQSLTSFS